MTWSRRRTDQHQTRVKEPLPQDALGVRLTALQIIGLASIGNGLTIAIREPVTGLSIFAFLPGWPGAYGMALAAFGVAIAVGSWLRWPMVTYAGAATAAGWYLLFGVGYLVQWGLWRSFSIGGVEPDVFHAWLNVAVAFILGAQIDVIRRTRRIERLLR